LGSPNKPASSPAYRYAAQSPTVDTNIGYAVVGIKHDGQSGRWARWRATAIGHCPGLKNDGQADKMTAC